MVSAPQLRQPSHGVSLPVDGRELTQHGWVEVNRGLYMDEGTGDRLPEFATVACLVQEAVMELIAVA